MVDVNVNKKLLLTPRLPGIRAHVHESNQTFPSHQMGPAQKPTTPARLPGPVPLAPAHMYMAAISGDVATLNATLAAGIDANETAHDGTTPLIAAASASQNEALTVLIANGADVNIVCPFDGASALYISALNGNLAGVQILLAAGAQAIAASNGETPKIAALAAGRADIAALL